MDFNTTDRQLFYTRVENRLLSYGQQWLRCQASGSETQELLSKIEDLSLGLEQVLVAIPAESTLTEQLIYGLCSRHRLLEVTTSPFTSIGYVQEVGTGITIHNQLLGLQKVGDGSGYYHLSQDLATYVQLQAATATAALRRYSAAITDWKVDETCKILFPSDVTDSLFTALQAGQLPSPVKGLTTPYWRPAAAPPLPVFLKPAVYLQGGAEQDLLSNSSVVPGQPYAIYRSWNNSVDLETVLVDGGLDSDHFAYTGQLYDTNNDYVGEVSVDVAAGTYTPVAGGSEYVRGDSNNNLRIGVIDPGTISVGCVGCTLLNGSGNSITDGESNTISGGAGNAIGGGGKYNAIIGGLGNTITSGDYITLIACENFAAPAISNATYLNNKRVEPGSTFEVPFNAGSENTQTIGVGTTAATYTAKSTINVASATLNGQPLTLPVTLAPGVDYALTITRTIPANRAVLTLSA